jgi:hypothetical protein
VLVTALTPTTAMSTMFSAARSQFSPRLDISRDTSLQILTIRPKTPRTPMSWDPKDDILLKRLKEEQRLGWKEIATHCESCLNIDCCKAGLATNTCVT